jgi:hypothetical protein
MHCEVERSTKQAGWQVSDTICQQPLTSAMTDRTWHRAKPKSLFAQASAKKIDGGDLFGSAKGDANSHSIRQ